MCSVSIIDEFNKCVDRFEEDETLTSFQGAFVKEVNYHNIRSGSFKLLQPHFYEKYDEIIDKAGFDSEVKFLLDEGFIDRKTKREIYHVNNKAKFTTNTYYTVNKDVEWEGRTFLNSSDDKTPSNQERVNEVFEALMKKRLEKEEMKEYQDKWGDTVKYKSNDLINQKVVDRIIQYCKDTNTTCGEGLHQSDDSMIGAPSVLSDIIDDLLEMEIT